MSSAADVLDFSYSFLPNPTGAAAPPGFVIVLNIYMDESGTHDGSPVVTVGAYLGTPKNWANWTRKWNKAKGPIEVFHAVDCSNLHGEFEGWNLADKNEYVAKLLPVLGDANLISAAVGIRMDDYREIAAEYPELQEMIGSTPFTPCFQWVLQNIFALMERNDDRQPVSIVHEANDYQGEAMMTFRFLQGIYPHREMELTFGTKSGYVPLQAADILAYEANRRLRDLTGPHRKAWAALNPSKGSRDLKYFDKPALIKWAKGVQARRLSAFLGQVRV